MQVLIVPNVTSPRNVIIMVSSYRTWSNKLLVGAVHLHVRPDCGNAHAEWPGTHVEYMIRGRTYADYSLGVKQETVTVGEGKRNRLLDISNFPSYEEICAYDVKRELRRTLAGFQPRPLRQSFLSENLKDRFKHLFIEDE